MQTLPWLLGALALALAVPGAGGAGPAANGRIVFASDRNGAAELFSVESDGTELRRLTRSFPAAAYGLDWSPRGGRIAFSRPLGSRGAKEIWTTRPNGTGLRRLTRPAGRCDSFPAWSPDARRIAFARDRCGGGRELWIMNADGSNPRRIRTLVGDQTWHISWSPDGKLLAVEGVGGGCAVLLVPVSGAAPRRQFCRLPIQGVAFSPDGRRLAFSRSGSVNDTYLFIARLDGGGLRRIGPRLRRADGLTWSRAGVIAFSTTGRQAGIHTIRADGTGLRRLTRAPTSLFDGSPAWSADGRTLAYVRGSGDFFDGQLRTVRADGARDRAIARYAPASSPSWTADGKSIVFAQGAPPTHAHIIGERGGPGRILLERPGEIAHPRLAPGGTSLAYVFHGLWSLVFVRKLPAGPTRTLAGGDSPAWSPDGKRLAYIGFDTDDDGLTFPGSVWTVNPDSTGRQRLTRGVDASTPAWSPDGGRIAFVTDDDDGLGDVWVMDANGADQRLLTEGGARPSWSSDGRLIVFTRDDDLIVVDVASGNERTLVREGQLVSGRVSGPAWQPFRR